MLFPAPYSSAIANLGYLTIWDRLNTAGGFLCDRACWDPRYPVEPEGIDTGLPLSAFPLILISSSSELDLPVVIDALMAAGIEPEAAKRQGRPLIVAGGITLTLNPAPWGPLLDLAILGEGEEAILQWIKCYADWQKRSGSREELLASSDEMPFVWVPERPQKDVIPAKFDAYQQYPAHSTVIHPDGHFGDCFLIEITRGCPRRCKFCAACGAFPSRFASGDAIIELLESTEALGSEKIGLVGAAVGDHPQLKRISRYIVESGRKITLSSVRIERTDEELLEILSQGGFRSLTIAPEMGSENGRFNLGKKATDADILKMTQAAAESGLTHLRMYFLIGLPDPEPVEAISELIAWLRNETPNSLMFDLSVGSFIPKPATPWETAPFAGITYLEKLKKSLTKNLKPIPRISIRFESTRIEELAAMLSRGDYQLGEILIASKKSNRSLKQQIRLVNLDLSRYLSPSDTITNLPWTFIQPHD